MFRQLLLISLVAAVAITNRLEKYLSKCRNQRLSRFTCMQNLGNKARPLIKQGIKEFGLPSIDPFEIPQINISQVSQDISYTAQLNDFALHNFSNYQLLNLDQTNGRVMAEVRFPKITLTTFYEVDGTLLRKLFKGSGFGQASFFSVYVQAAIVYDTFFKSGMKYCKISKVDVNVTISDTYMEFEGLHRDSLSVTNEFLNAHSDLISTSTSNSFGKIFETYLKKQYDNLCSNDPSFITKTLFV